MTHPNRGLELSDLSSLTQTEREAFSAFYTRTLGHTHRGLDFWLEHGPETLKRYRLYSDSATPNNYESSRELFVFGFLPFYAVIGYDVGVRYLLHTRQRMGMTKAHIIEGIAISFLVMGPAGMETVDRALTGFEWIEPDAPAQFPAGWAPDTAALRSGLDFGYEDLRPGELELLQDWYRRTLGEVPLYVEFLGRHRPRMLKAYRNRFEHCVRELPKQFVPTTLLHYDVLRGFREGIRENVLLARAFGVTRELVLNTIGSASLNAGMSGLSIAYEAAGDVLASWDR